MKIFKFLSMLFGEEDFISQESQSLKEAERRRKQREEGSRGKEEAEGKRKQRDEGRRRKKGRSRRMNESEG